jgi:hypothetical protein
MRTLRYLLISCLFTLGIFTATTYTACNRDKCNNTTCNNGSCFDGICTCTPGFEGANCETDLCKNVTCENGGMCVNGECKCPAGYEGEHCEGINKFIGEYTATDSCNGGAIMKIYVTALSMKGNGEMVLRITNFSNFQSVVYASISSSGNTFSISGTNYEGYHIEGSGEYDNGTGNVKIGYTVSYPNGNISCVGTWVRYTQ